MTSDSHKAPAGADLGPLAMLGVHLWRKRPLTCHGQKHIGRAREGYFGGAQQWSLAHARRTCRSTHGCGTGVVCTRSGAWTKDVSLGKPEPDNASCRSIRSKLMQQRKETVEWLNVCVAAHRYRCEHPEAYANAPLGPMKANANPCR